MFLLLVSFGWFVFVVYFMILQFVWVEDIVDLFIVIFFKGSLLYWQVEVFLLFLWWQVVVVYGLVFLVMMLLLVDWGFGIGMIFYDFVVGWFQMKL